MQETTEDKAIYRETQRPPFMLRFIVLVVALPVLAATVKHLVLNESFGDFPKRDYFLLIIGILVGFVLPYYYLRSIFTVEVHEDGILVKSWPFLKTPHKIPIFNLSKYKTVSYMAVGFLSRIRRTSVYSGFGTSGVQLEYANRDQIYVGSRTPEKMVEAIDIALNKDIGMHILMNLDRIQPSQMYINSEKLAHFIKDLKKPFLESIGPLPVKKIDDRIVYLGGHTKAFAAYFLGLTEVRIKWVEEDINFDEYKRRIDMCRREGIHTISDLRRRVVTPEDYKELWLAKIGNDEEETHGEKSKE